MSWSAGQRIGICDVANQRTVGIFARSLAEVKEAVLEKFHFIPDTFRIFRDDMSTEVENEMYFCKLPDDTKLMVVSKRGEWITGTPGMTLN